MALEFAGPAKRFSDEAIESAAKKIGCAVAAVRAVIDVESRGGFFSDGRPKILFERHYFSRLTGGKHDKSNPDISAKKWGGYKGGPAEYDRLHRAIKLDRDCALRSASWGAFQIMGDNYKLCGFGNVADFVKAMVAGEPEQLDAFVSFVKKSRLDDELIRLDWVGFARGYNGPAYRANRYDEKLAAAYRYHLAGGARVNSPLPVLKMGDTGEDVKTLQARLKITADGDFGPATKAAVVAFQRKHGLYPDGVVGKNTWLKLGVP
ncbi:MAG TPA: N-acetylmuramidase domain-containing protein [Sphingomicrobium sp.]|nr:N-acetylmuramidase domain-containing protein [Sphingomicrobium sp.]